MKSLHIPKCVIENKKSRFTWKSMFERVWMRLKAQRGRKRSCAGVKLALAQNFDPWNCFKSGTGSHRGPRIARKTIKKHSRLDFTRKRKTLPRNELQKDNEEGLKTKKTISRFLRWMVYVPKQKGPYQCKASFKFGFWVCELVKFWNMLSGSIFITFRWIIF